ncbi:MAG TPA: endolytic transglycosylase MltG [Ktedonobacterales bacterium]
MKKRQRLALALALLLMTCGLVGGYGAWTIGLNYIQPAGPAGSPQIPFVIQPGETTAQIGDDLVAKKIISNALGFRLWARYKGLDHSIKAGVYQLSASMTIPEIVDKLQNFIPNEFQVKVFDGERIFQIVKDFASETRLQKFNSDDFLQIAKTGVYTNAAGKSVALASEYWFLNHDKQAGTAPNFALEGYLFPDFFEVDQDATAADIVHMMLNDFGEHLCPGPDGHPDAYLNDEQQCEAHPTQDPKTHQSIFDLLKKNYSDADGKNMADKLFHALTLASIVEREALTASDDQGIAAVYYKRYLVSKGALQIKPGQEGVQKFQSDPTVSYSLGTADNAWPPVRSAGDTYNSGPYNTYHTVGLPPGPICSPAWAAVAATINPPSTPYFFFFGDKKGIIRYAQTYQEQLANYQKYGLPTS